MLKAIPVVHQKDQLPTVALVLLRPLCKRGSLMMVKSHRKCGHLAGCSLLLDATNYYTFFIRKKNSFVGCKLLKDLHLQWCAYDGGALVGNDVHMLVVTHKLNGLPTPWSLCKSYLIAVELSILAAASECGNIALQAQPRLSTYDAEEAILQA